MGSALPGLPADGARRVVIESITPCVDGGRFAAKRIVGERLVVEADVFADGHDAVRPATHATPAEAAGAEAGFEPRELVRLALERRVTLDGDPRDWNVAQVLAGSAATLGVA